MARVRIKKWISRLGLGLLLWGACLPVGAVSTTFYDLQWSGNGFWTAGVNRLVKYWDFATTRPLHKHHFHLSSVKALALSRDQKTVISGDDRGQIIVWQPGMQAGIHYSVGSAYINDLAVAPVGNQFAAALSNREIQIFDLDRRVRVLSLLGHQASVTQLLYLSNGDLLSVDMQGTMMRWDGRTGEQLWSFKPHQGHIMSLTLSHDEKIVATGGQAGEIQLWHIDGFGVRPIKTLQQTSDFIYALAFSPDDRFLMAGSRSGEIRLWDLDQDLSRVWQAANSAVFVRQLVFSPSGDKLAAAGGGLLSVWEWPSGKLVRYLK